MSVTEVYSLLTALEDFRIQANALCGEVTPNVGRCEVTTSTWEGGLSDLRGVQVSFSVVLGDGTIHWTLAFLCGPTGTEVSARIVGNYFDEPYQTLIESIYETQPADLRESSEALVEAKQLILASMQAHITQQNMERLLAGGREAPFFPNL
ncbi:hypothetical protein [Deinococcus radiotolerans]|uniref:Uncharacterized protein n=1 Tax=Deinococcus radiotolerans TaxID=1309407 RepID=A0ABQ2FJL7_9DEIO|nr:hypothetical protein [Deinococcus radiotolerans]GGL04527.1 hypothetical protein GCM10010844_24000 [Deinococcus radiotolerans]